MSFQKLRKFVAFVNHMNLSNFLNPRIDRPLQDWERQNHLDPSRRIDTPPRPQTNVIRINSTYLEYVDALFSLRGLLAWGGSCIFFITSGLGFTLSLFDTIYNWNIYHKLGQLDGHISTTIFVLIITAPVAWFSWHFARLDYFKHSHFPIRFNRKNQMIYVFRYDGTVLEVPWKNAHFALNKINRGNISVYVMKEDRQTAQEIFQIRNVGGVEKGALQIWEHIRSYMEEGPQRAHAYTTYCLPIADRRESPWISFWALELMLAPYLPLQILMSPIFLMVACFRYLAILTCRIPRFPAPIEEACAIEPGDPCVKDWRTNRSWLSKRLKPDPENPEVETP